MSSATSSPATGDALFIIAAIRALNARPGDGECAITEMQQAGAELINADRIAA